jgi:hypothetical protein
MIDKRLIGTWKSDRELTFKHHVFKAGVKPAIRRKFRDIFGILTVTYTRTKIVADYKGSGSATRYRVLAKDDYSAVLWRDETVYRDPKIRRLFKENPELLVRGRNLLQIHFVAPDAYWIYTDGSDGFREFFRRVSPCDS